LALTLNGKKKKIGKKDFLEAFSRFKIFYKLIEVSTLDLSRLSILIKFEEIRKEGGKFLVVRPQI
jgi:hypothetical protein